jgi:hypothetical protein
MTMQTMPELFHVRSKIANMHGFKNVAIVWFVDMRAQPLFGENGSLGVEYGHVITNYDATDRDFCCAELAVEEMFTKDEAEAFQAFVRAKRNDATATIEPAKLPIANNIMGYGAIPTGGGPDFLMIGDRPDYDLPFKVWGFYDVRGYEFDEKAPGARRAVRGVRIRDGEIEPWFLEDDAA